MHSVHQTLVVIPITMPIWAIDNPVAYCTDVITFEPFIFSRRHYINRTHSWDENVPTIAEPSSIAVTTTSIDSASMATIRMDDSIFGPQTVTLIVGIARQKKKIARVELNTFLDFILYFLKLVCTDIECMSVFIYLYLFVFIYHKYESLVIAKYILFLNTMMSVLFWLVSSFLYTFIIII